MRKELLIIALGFTAVAGRAAADVLAVPEGPPTPEITLPAKGSTMTDVEKKFGAPRTKQPTVGGDAPKHPPITRWDYDGFVVIFEKDRVVDAVVPGAPPKVYHKDKLTPVPGAAPAASMPPPAAPAAATAAPAQPPAEAPPEAPAEPSGVPAQPAEAPTAPAEGPATPPEAPQSSAPSDSAASLAGTAPASGEPAASEPAPADAPADPGHVATPENPTPDAPPPAP